MRSHERQPVTIEFYGRFADEIGIHSITREWEPGLTVRTLLDDLSGEYPSLSRLLGPLLVGGVNPQSVVCVVNGRLLTLAGGFERELDCGDILRVIPQYTGG